MRISLDDPRWLDFVRGASGASFFHHPAWARLVAECYGYNALAFVVTDGSGAITGGLPLVEVRTTVQGSRWIALPFTDHCLPLGMERERLIAALTAEAALNRVDRVEIRSAVADLPSRVVAVRHSVALPPDPREVHARLSTMHQRNIRKATRAGVEITRGVTERDLDVFYELHLRTRRRHGVPIQPRRFFRLLQHRVIDAGHGFVLTASLGGKPIASAVFLAWNGVLIYKYGASDERAWEHRPNNLLLWTAMAWGCEHGYRSFDLGRSDLADEGLRSFKSGWGATEEPLVHSGTSMGTAHARPMVEWALATAIRRSHPWLSRALGELLYRYAA
jgi:CelD/BcsL family acetyltransferase involved in cellulose biosynthesis